MVDVSAPHSATEIKSDLLSSVVHIQLPSLKIRRQLDDQGAKHTSGFLCVTVKPIEVQVKEISHITLCRVTSCELYTTRGACTTKR